MGLNFLTGKNGPLVTSLGLGAMGLSAFYGKIDNDSERFKILDRAYDLGFRHWDTADMYGDNEDLIGAWFAKNPEKRADIFLATKFAAIVGLDGITIRSDPEYVHIACEKSLKRLGVATIDLYYCHRLDEKTPIEKTVKAMVELKMYDLSISSLNAICYSSDKP
jgi:aryl-alcohol dehydrogenase-like predicted oxidoreductase